MSNKKTISIISIWIASFLFGVFYNINLLRLPYANLWFNFSRTTLLYVLVGILCASLTFLLKDFIKTKLKMKKTMYFMWIAVIGTALCYLRFNNIREDLINGAFILLIYPLSLMTIYNAPKYKYKYLVMYLSILATGA